MSWMRYTVRSMSVALYGRLLVNDDELYVKLQNFRLCDQIGCCINLERNVDEKHLIFSFVTREYLSGIMWARSPLIPSSTFARG